MATKKISKNISKKISKKTNKYSRLSKKLNVKKRVNKLKGSGLGKWLRRKLGRRSQSVNITPEPVAPVAPVATEADGSPMPTVAWGPALPEPPKITNNVNTIHLINIDSRIEYFLTYLENLKANKSKNNENNYNKAYKYLQKLIKHKEYSVPLLPPKTHNMIRHSLALPTQNTETFENFHKIIHFWYREWSDHGAPDILDLKLINNNTVDTGKLSRRFRFITFVNKLCTNINDNGGGTVIHCSAGVGRTGTLFVILKLIYDNECKDLTDLINRMTISYTDIKNAIIYFYVNYLA